MDNILFFSKEIDKYTVQFHSEVTDTLALEVPKSSEQEPC